MNILDSIFIERIGPRDKAEVFVQYTETKKNQTFIMKKKYLNKTCNFFFMTRPYKKPGMRACYITTGTKIP